ncbi:MAG: hypothetical protein JXO22_13295, partial [Phycisphaerae bacterium]|nr:hypothetical protein [Phycisphaerae bacterium]
INNAGVPEPNGGLWEWHIHQAQGPEACCLEDGTCRILTPEDCVAFGGFPQGMGSVCDPNPCLPQDVGACCYGDPPTMCTVTTQLDCEQNLMGQWMGVGTDCSDLNGNQVADICEVVEEPGACCFEDNGIQCVVTLQVDCEQNLNGDWKGALTTCDDLNGDGVADICEEKPYRFEFSLDIGSDKELSDPVFDGDEAFDPGDVYWWQSAPVVPPGRDGFKDDMMILGQDPYPAAPDATGSTRVPVGFGDIEMFANYFDLDGHDQIEIDLKQDEIIPMIAPLAAPLPWGPTQCIHPAEFLIVSFDDDKAPSWPAGDVPVTAKSPYIGMTFGSTMAMDEVMGITLDPMAGVWPLPTKAMYPIADETTVHQSLALNPDDGTDEEDDDVDSLDIVLDEGACPFWYFTADHEAHFGLDPGDIYEVTGLGPMRVIDDVIHLGLSDDTDIDAFEFAVVGEPGMPGGQQFLAVLFSVDDDDPLTPQNESGGLFPTVVYASFLDGTHFQLSEPQMDDIDALTVWTESLEPAQPYLCGDANCDGVVDVFDIDAFVLAITNPVAYQAVYPCFVDCDTNCDNVIDVFDIDSFVGAVTGSAPCNCPQY